MSFLSRVKVVANPTDIEEKYWDEIDNGKKKAKQYPPSNSKSGFRDTYEKSNLENALSYVEMKNKDVHFVGYQMLDPSDLTDIKFRHLWERNTRGWGRDLTPKKLVTTLAKEMERVDYDYVWMWRRTGEQWPVIVIDGIIADGMGRTAFYHALGERVRAAVFNSSN